MKDELAQLIPNTSCCRRTELAALLRASGSISIGGPDRLACTFTTDHAPVARKIFRLVRQEFQLKTEVRVFRRRRLRKNLFFRVHIPPQAGVRRMLELTGVLDPSGVLSDWGDLANLANDHCRRAYLRGTFLGTGWMATPERQHHMEMTVSSTEAADELGQLLFQYGLPVRLAYRKEAALLYLKDADQIARFLVLIGAHQALLKYEDVRALKEMKNRVNRQVNFETANLNKTADAAARQIEGLRRLMARGSFQRLPAPLRELAQLRLNFPEASLKELGELCEPKVGKSGVNHRMRQLMNMLTDDLLM